MINISNFTKFLVEAKQNTFSPNVKRENSSRPHSKDSVYRKYGFHYLDSYLGNENIIGEELVWDNEKICWGMNYNGGITVPHAPNGLNTFLKDALKLVDETTPIRGPKHFQSGDFSYHCNWNGDINNFYGIELITHNGTEVYKLHFHGGKVE